MEEGILSNYKSVTEYLLCEYHQSAQEITYINLFIFQNLQQVGFM